jgi:hypothetical protein
VLEVWRLRFGLMEGSAVRLLGDGGLLNGGKGSGGSGESFCIITLGEVIVRWGYLKEAKTDDLRARLAD